MIIQGLFCKLRLDINVEKKISHRLITQLLQIMVLGMGSSLGKRSEIPKGFGSKTELMTQLFLLSHMANQGPQTFGFLFFQVCRYSKLNYSAVF